MGRGRGGGVHECCKTGTEEVQDPNIYFNSLQHKPFGTYSDLNRILYNNHIQYNDCLMPCCKCNGLHACCSSCDCVKHNRPCLSCHAGKYGRCNNTLPSGNQAESLPTTSTSTVTQACASMQTLMPPTHSPLIARSRSPSLDARNSQSPSNAHMNSSLTQTQLQIIGSPQQLPHLRRRRSQVGEPSRGFSGSHSQPILITQLQPTPTPGDSSQPTAPNQPGSSTMGASRQRCKQHCVVEGCPELIAPSMWKSHMTLHAQRVFPREIPSTWLDEQDRYICHICLQLVSNRRQSSHSKKCHGGGVVSSVPDFAGPLPPNPAETPLNQPEPGLLTFEDVCLLNQPTLRFVPSKSRPAFA